MKDFLKDYGMLIGPTLAFALGVLAIYIKFHVDRQVDHWEGNKKFNKLVQLIGASSPPTTYFPSTSVVGLHVDQARNLTNATIFSNKIVVVKSFMDSIESDVNTNCSLLQVQQFYDIKFIITYLIRNIDSYKNSITDKATDRFRDPEHAFSDILQDFDRLLNVCSHPKKDFNYIGG